MPSSRVIARRDLVHVCQGDPREWVKPPAVHPAQHFATVEQEIVTTQAALSVEIQSLMLQRLEERQRRGVQQPVSLEAWHSYSSDLHAPSEDAGGGGAEMMLARLRAGIYGFPAELRSRALAASDLASTQGELNEAITSFLYNEMLARMLVGGAHPPPRHQPSRPRLPPPLWRGKISPAGLIGHAPLIARLITQWGWLRSYRSLSRQSIELAALAGARANLALTIDVLHPDALLELSRATTMLESITEHHAYHAD
ncbi:MAG: hypothetical protein SGPRY_007305, partial [Prymnesium sp.]